MITIKSNKPYAVVSVCKDLHVIYTNKTLIKNQIYRGYTINEVKVGQTYIIREEKKKKKVGLCSEKKNPYYLFFLPLGLSPVDKHCKLLHKYIHSFVNSSNLIIPEIYKRKAKPTDLEK